MADRENHGWPEKDFGSLFLWCNNIKKFDSVICKQRYSI